MNYQLENDDPEQDYDSQKSNENVDSDEFDEDNFMRWQLETIRSSGLDSSQDFAGNDDFEQNYDSDADPEENG